MTPLQQAAQALVDRWDTPLWKDVPATGEYINALRAALSAPAGWQPIETMPRTGKMALMWSRNAGFFAGNWPQGCFAGEWLKISGDWRGSSHWRAQEATHWMPLPTPPAAPSPQEQT